MCTDCSSSAHALHARRAHIVITILDVRKIIRTLKDICVVTKEPYNNIIWYCTTPG